MGLPCSGEGRRVTFSFLQLLRPMLFMEDSFPSTPCGCCCCSRWICSRIFRASWMAFITVSWSPNRAGELRLDRISAYTGCVIRGMWGQSLKCWLWSTPQRNTVFSEQGRDTFDIKKTTTLFSIESQVKQAILVLGAVRPWRTPQHPRLVGCLLSLTGSNLVCTGGSICCFCL